MTKQPAFKFNFGEHVRDVVTKLEGVVISRTEYVKLLCVQYKFK